jgi:hypothetical protein
VLRNDKRLWSAFGTCWVVQCHHSIEYKGPFCLKLHVDVVLDTGSFWFLLCLICSYFLSLVCSQQEGMPCILTTIYVLTFLKPSTMYRPRCSEMISGLWSAFGTCWVVQCHPSIEYTPRISTTEHVHALCFLSHICYNDYPNLLYLSISFLKRDILNNWYNYYFRILDNYT